MNRKKCPSCNSPITKRNGKRNGVQLYKCQARGRQFRAGEKPTNELLWYLYQERKQTASEIAEGYGVSRCTINRRLKHIEVGWQQPNLQGMSGYVHLDATYWGRNWGVLAAIDEATSRPLYRAFIKKEKVEDYMLAITTLVKNGYEIKGLILDGVKGVFLAYPNYKIQMCQYHMERIIVRYLTQNPQLAASIALMLLIKRLPQLTRLQFEKEYNEWKKQYDKTLKERSKSTITGKTSYTHKRLRGAMRSIDFFLPYLFTYQETICDGMPNTNNKIEGIFTDLKKNLNNHSGLSEDSRKRFITGFFLALESKSANQNSSEPKPTAASL